MIPDSIKQVLADNTSGSVTLLKRLIVALENLLMDPEVDPATFISWIEYTRKKLEMFTVIRHFCDELILSHNVSVRNYPANYLDFMLEYREFWERAPQLLANNLKNSISLDHKTIMLHSNSGTIREVFRLISGDRPDIKFFQTISSPAEEGRIQAHDLAGMGYHVTLFADAVAAEMMKKTDYLLLGADQVTSDSIINKTGSLQMILAAKEFDVPVIVLTESRKINRTGDKPFSDDARDPGEVLNDIRHPNIEAVNIYFEEFPKYLVNQVITEKRP